MLRFIIKNEVKITCGYEFCSYTTIDYSNLELETILESQGFSEQKYQIVFFDSVAEIHDENIVLNLTSESFFGCGDEAGELSYNTEMFEFSLDFKELSEILTSTSSNPRTGEYERHSLLGIEVISKNSY